MNPDRFADLASALRGPFGWKSALAREFQVHRSTVLRWSEGKIPIPPKVEAALEEEAAHRAARIQALVAE